MKQMVLSERILALMLRTEVRLRQGVERDSIVATLLEALVLEAEFQQVVMAAEEAGAVVAAVVQQRVEQMALRMLLEQAEQVFHLRFLATMEEMPECMAQVEMAEQIEAVAS